MTDIQHSGYFRSIMPHFPYGKITYDTSGVRKLLASVPHLQIAGFHSKRFGYPFNQFF
jgi:hypothetical protein